MKKLSLALALLCLALSLGLFGCAPAATDASKSRSRGVIESGGIVPAEELRVAEYLGYYEQHFPVPTDSTLGLDVRLGNPQIPTDGGTAWVQVGVQARSSESDAVAPLNLALVIDRSGSMQSPEKMPYLKQSLKMFLHTLSANDRVALVAFDTQAEILQPSTPVGDGAWIDAAVEKLSPTGTTNLHAGLMLGFKEVDRNFDVRRNNRVILLTDGQANAGVTNAGQIASDARAYNDKGIYLSTIGLGLSDYNDSLLSQLANQGKGAYHFIDSAAEMDKVFRREVSGLLQKAASNVSLTVRPENGVKIESITGYDGTPPSGPVQIKLKDMGTGDNQVVLIKLNAAPFSAGTRPLVGIELTYQDLFAKRDAQARLTVGATAGALSSYDPVWDIEVLRNVTVQRTAEGLKEIDRLYRAKRYQDAWQLAYRLERDISAIEQLTKDPQMAKDVETMRKYEGTLAKWVEQQTGRPPLAPEYSVPMRRDSARSSGTPTTAIEIK